MAHEPAVQQKGLGPGFWPVTIVMTVINVIVTIFIIWLPIENYLPEAAKPADQIDALFKFMSVIGNAIFVYVTGYLIYFCIVWRRRKTDHRSAIGIQIHDHAKLELWWTVVPSLLVVLIAIFSVRIWAGLQNTPGNGLTMESIGHQFKYEFRYPTLTASVYDDMHVPVDTPISLHVTSVDVIHSFWVPEVRVKYDMVPGLVQTLRFTPTKIGKFRIICTEFCGTNHGNMLATMTIESKADFKKWIAAQASKAAADRSGGGVALASGDAAAGKTAFAAKCSSCHAVAAFDKKIVGPGLAGIAHDPAHPQLVTGIPPTAANIAAILTNGYNGPIGMMPNKAANGLSNKDIADLTAYLLTLK